MFEPAHDFNTGRFVMVGEQRSASPLPGATMAMRVLVTETGSCGFDPDYGVRPLRQRVLTQASAMEWKVNIEEALKFLDEQGSIRLMSVDTYIRSGKMYARIVLKDMLAGGIVVRLPEYTT